MPECRYRSAISSTKVTNGVLWASAGVSLALLIVAFPLSLVTVMKSDPCGMPSDGFICSADNQSAVFVLGTLVNAVAYFVLLAVNLWRRSVFWARAWPLVHLAIVMALMSVPTP